MTLHTPFHTLHNWLNDQILGQPQLIDRLLIALLADGHLLVEGAPGLAKTKAIKMLAKGLAGDFHRIQFTPDLLPGDVTGTDVFRPEDSSFQFQPGPIFHSLILADEINRAPAKVQSALLEAMGERQVSIGHKSYPLPAVFLVMATQNPIEQEGTYPLPEAQLDRFLMHVTIDYPDVETERAILALARHEALASQTDKPPATPPTPLRDETIMSARTAVLNLHCAESVQEYIVQIVIATRQAKHYHHELATMIEYGASPRATISLDRCARAHAWLQGKDFVSPDNVQAVVHDVLRHRLILSFEAEASGVTKDHVMDKLLQHVPTA